MRLTAVVAVEPGGNGTVSDPLQRIEDEAAHVSCIRVIETDVSAAQSSAEVPVTGYDMTYVEADSTLYVVERNGKQAVAFDLDVQPGGAISFLARRDAVPLHAFGERAVVSYKDGAFVDVVGSDSTRDGDVHWVRLYAEAQPRYLRAATVVLPVLDGKERGCVWDRFLLDACLPSETSVRVATRAADQRELLLAQPFEPEPDLYRRGLGAELPYYEPFADRTPRPHAAGTWELLFQRARGQFLQIRLEIGGNGRASPGLRALRAYYPRFSYPCSRYLPGVYQDDPDSASFLERLLANPQGFYTDIEGKIAEVGMLLDPRSAPPEALDWLAGWLGLVLDPLWADIQRRRTESMPTGTMPGRAVCPGNANPPQPSPDRRRLFIRFALRLYE